MLPSLKSIHGMFAQDRTKLQQPGRIKESRESQALVTHTCNPRYSGD
jgi:hypothetical protein